MRKIASTLLPTLFTARALHTLIYAINKSSVLDLRYYINGDEMRLLLRTRIVAQLSFHIS